ncbi:MAG: hypothetical protein JSW54_12760 [Fidelibacterota bacterium]|nr:MAG: hypothetical protein JSW54_12760 [Candidatus Neomarinimicrobiota bacterium]
MKTTRMALMAMFVALMVGSGWALAMVPNIEFVTALAFTAGATLGPGSGALAGAAGMFLFSATNPIGSGLAFPVLLIAQVVSQAGVGLLGGLFSRTSWHNLHRWPMRTIIALAGLTGTLLYDGLTSISFPLYAGARMGEILTLLVSGLAFTVLHQVSNTMIFFLLVPRMIMIGRKYHTDSAPRSEIDSDHSDAPADPPTWGLQDNSDPGKGQSEIQA